MLTGGRKSARKRVFLNAPLEWNSAYSDYDYLGLVFNVVDEVAHSRHLNKGGKRLLQLILEMHLAESNLAEVISNLLELGFRVYLTADHGIVNCRAAVTGQINTWQIPGHGGRCFIQTDFWPRTLPGQGCFTLPSTGHFR